MKIKLAKIKILWYVPQEEVDPKFMEELAKSMDETRQWDDILVRRKKPAHTLHRRRASFNIIRRNSLLLRSNVFN